VRFLRFLSEQNVSNDYIIFRYMSQISTFSYPPLSGSAECLHVLFSVTVFAKKSKYTQAY